MYKRCDRDDSSPTVADLDNDGKKEIIVAVGSTWVNNQQGGLVVFNNTGTVRWRYKATTTATHGSRCSAERLT